MKDLESYLLEMDMPYEEIGEGIWVLHDDMDHIDNVVVIWSPPLVTFRVKMMELPEGENSELYQMLLNLNANDMIHGAYGIEGNNIVVMNTLQSENLDLNEFKASVDALAMALRDHYPALSKFRTKA